MPGESDAIMRNATTGGLQVYDIANNQITGSAFLGTVGLDWQFAGVAPVRGPGTSDLVLRNVTSGAFEVYDIANNQITGAASLGQVGLNWQLGGLSPIRRPAPWAARTQTLNSCRRCGSRRRRRRHFEHHPARGRDIAAAVADDAAARVRVSSKSAAAEQLRFAAVRE